MPVLLPVLVCVCLMDHGWYSVVVLWWWVKFWKFIPLIYPGIDVIWMIYKNVTCMCTCAFLWGCIEWAHTANAHPPTTLHPFPSILNPSTAFPIISSLTIGYYTLACIYQWSSLIWFIVCLPNGHFMHLQVWELSKDSFSEDDVSILLKSLHP